MKTKIFVNLPVADLNKSIAFYEGMGYQKNPDFSDETAACIVISEEIYVMVLTHAKFKEFTPLPIGDANKQTQVILAMSASSKTEVNDMLNRATTHGGSEPRAPQDLGFMYSRAFADPDGHIWEAFWMEPSAIPAN
jgi:predicted lactoylglutathione lyase